jgi:hypothetical protein
MILQFLTAYAELVAELTKVGGPQHHDLTGDLEKDGRHVSGWLHHMELNLQYYAEERPDVHAEAAAVVAAWKVWGADDTVARQALCEMFLDMLRVFYQLSGTVAKSCTLTESQAMLMYKRGLLDCGVTPQTYAEWKAAGKVFGLDFSISTGFSIDS